MTENTVFKNCTYESYKIEKLIHSHDEVAEKMDNAADAIKVQTNTIDKLIKQNDSFFKILLVVVCVLALGKELLEQVKDIFMSKASAEIVSDR